MANTIMEEREEMMVSPLGGDPFLRRAYFLKPTTTDPPPSSPLSKNEIFDLRDTPLKVIFKGTTWPQNRWKDWVFKLLPKYKTIWKSAGIFDSILNSTYKIFRHNDLILALAERWCVETNTFVFPWGESTITLEDMIVLWGYSVLGNSVSSPLSTKTMKKIKEKLLETRRNIQLGTGRFVSHLVWLDHFIDSDDELEHVAFLALWLSRYVFSIGHGGIGVDIFPIAIHLSVGTRLAIAPPLLGTLYRDLSLIKKSIISFPKGSCLKSEAASVNLNIWAPIQLVQIWAWERFPTLRPNPNSIQLGDPRFARWHEKIQSKVDDLRMALDSAGEDFQWRPYCMVVNNWRFNEFYMTNRELVTVESGLDEEIESFTLCIRSSELVGLGGFIEQYLPHHVAMQFGFDQDIPGFVPRVNDDPDSAWENFKRPIGDQKLYIPPRLFESDVTFRYLAWWDPAMLGLAVQSELQENSLDEDDLTTEELFRSKKKANVVVEEGFERVDKCLMSNSFENLSTKDVKVVEEPKDISCSVVEYANKPTTSSSKVTYGEIKYPSDDLDLEPRISKLERMVAVLKAEYFGLNV